MQFDTAKNGYDKTEVEKHVETLNNELQTWKKRAMQAEADYIKLKERENEIKKNGENIALALTAAIEKAKQIENSSKNVYKLKIQQISILYDRWDMLLNEILRKHPMLEDSHNIRFMLQDFKKTIENVVSQNFENISQPEEKQNNNDTMRVLLSKMTKYSNLSNEEVKKSDRKIERNKLSKDLRTGLTELKRMEEKATMIKPITDLTLEKNENYETLAEKFLKEEITESPQYTNFMSKKIDNEGFLNPNESGFNLKEAVNPKDDLDEIMKSFDFFTDRDDD